MNFWPYNEWGQMQRALWKFHIQSSYLLEDKIIFTNYCQGIKRSNENLKLSDDVRSAINASVKALSPETKIDRKVKLLDTFVVWCIFSKVDDWNKEDIYKSIEF